MTVDELKKALTELAEKGYTQSQIAQSLVGGFVDGSYGKGFLCAALHLIGIGTSKIDGMSDEEAREAFRKAQREGAEPSSGREDSAEENNREAGAPGTPSEEDRGEDGD